MAIHTALSLERQLEAAQQITHIGSWEWDLASSEVTWSDELYRIYGLEPRSCTITLQTFLARVHPEDQERVSNEITAALARGGRFGHVERIVRPDGTVRELETVGEVLKDDSGRPCGLIGTCRDVTEERRREEAIRLYADVFRHVQIGLSVWRLDSPADPSSLRLVAYNAATEAATGLSLTGALGKTLPTIFPPARVAPLLAMLGGVDDPTFVRELPTFSFGTSPRAPILSVKLFGLPDHCVGLALEDITVHARAERLQAGERQALELLAGGAPLGKILRVIVELIEELAPETLASVLLLDESGTKLEMGAAPSMPETFNRAVDGAPIGPASGSCGTSAFLGAPVYVTDIAADPLWADYRDLALTHGLRACWSSPILANDGHVLGTFAIYYKEPREPEQAAKDLISRAAHVAGIAIERRQLDDDLRALPARLEGIREEERTGIAREIHDELGQALTALKMDIAWVSRRVPAGDAVAAKLAEMSRSADEILGSVRRISSELRPGVLDTLGLQAAIEWQAEEFQRRTGTPCGVRSGLGDVQLGRDLSTAVFRIFQEALTNIARHAGATEVVVQLGLERGNLKLEVSDDGVGLPAPAPRSGSLGLLGMRERARRLGGDCVIRDRTPRGTLVSLSLPLDARTGR
jgi:PAS domain S-box-containing protein